MTFTKNIRHKSILLLATTAIVFSFCSCCQAKDNGRQDAIGAITNNIKLPDIGPEKANILDFGAVGDGLKDCRPGIQAAIEEVSAAGGGKITFPKGTYLCKGPIHLQSKINLYLEEGATVLFSQGAKDYLPLQLVRWEGVELYNYSPYIYANNKTDIAITGKGKFNGNAIGGIAGWRGKQKPSQNLSREMGSELVPVEDRIFGEGHFLRMSFIQLMNCSNILIQGLSIENVPFWVIHPTYCNNITIQDVHVNSTRINNDGIDLDSCEDALVEDCTFNAGDDAIAIKSGRDQDAWRVNKISKNIVIRNCVAFNVLHGLAFGSEMSGGMENIYVNNFHMNKVEQYAIQFKANRDRGGFIRNVFIDGVTIDSTMTAIFFTNDYHSYRGGQNPSEFSHIEIKNLVCNYASGAGIDIQGLAKKPIHHLLLKNILIKKEDKPSVKINTNDSTFDNININNEQVMLGNAEK